MLSYTFSYLYSYIFNVCNVAYNRCIMALTVIDDPTCVICGYAICFYLVIASLAHFHHLYVDKNCASLNNANTFQPRQLSVLHV